MAKKIKEEKVEEPKVTKPAKTKPVIKETVSDNGKKPHWD